jgi:nicotinate-nucleotide adenylyltransferase
VRLGIFGGTFDPPHLGHLLAASDAFEHLSLERLVFVPAAVQPLKAGRATATAADRLAMVRLMVGDDPRFAVDSVEIDREGLSYTVDTLRGFARQYPLATRYFLVGADVLSSFAQWRDPRTILELATLAVLTRRDELDAAMPRRTDQSDTGAGDRAPDCDPAAEALGAELVRRATMVPTRRIDVSSTEIRDRVRSRKSIHGFVSDAVAAYIGSHGLYR